MRTSPLSLRRCGVMLACAGTTALSCLTSLTAQPPGERPDRSRGELIFHHEFEPNIDPDVPGDGLGPLFNARSCVACHHQGGSGGAGANRFNVHILSVIPPDNLRGEDRRRFRQELENIHPDLGFGSIILHREGTRPRYAQWRERILGLQFDNPEKQMPERVRRQRGQALASQGPVIRLPQYRGFNFMVTQRNTSSLLGAGLIDAIPDQAIRQAASWQAQRNDGIGGRISEVPAADGKGTVIGRFGWRGQMPSLEEFVRGACAGELGLQVGEFRQPLDPTRRVYDVNDPDLFNIQAGNENGPDLVQEMKDPDFRSLVMYVESLPPPARRMPEHKRDLAKVLQGQAHFNSLGCATCHLPRLGDVEGIYSDLLLHDMGPLLEDPVPTPGIAAVSQPVPPPEVVQGGWLGRRPREAFVMAPNLQAFRSWRTPPLWGVGQTGPYMHDGRAATLHQAILYHGGEADRSRQAYVSLNLNGKQALWAFLNGMGQPPDQ